MSEKSAPKSQRPPPSNLAVRVLTAVVALPLILGLIFRGPPWALFALILPAAMVGAFELFAMTHPGDRGSQTFGVLLAAAAGLVVYFFGRDPRVLLTLLIVLPALGPLLTLARLGDIQTAGMRSFAIGAGALMVSVPLVLLAVIRRDDPRDGPTYVVMSLSFAWAADTGGYFGGRFFGRHKLYEAVSPKKTIEGAIGGLLAAALSAVLIQVILKPLMPLWHTVVLSIVAGALGQAGDLGESLIKRSVGVKDSGAIVPGHGGILDRVDALLLTSSCVYLYTLWFGSAR
ncbi:MAG: phosphatidate cytidylyltransferase [Polyangiaceae bacterium]